MEIEKKLKHFEEVCLEMSNTDKNNLKKELDKKAENKIKKELDSYQKKLNNKLEKEKIKLEKDYHKKIVDLELNSKKQILEETHKEENQLFKDCINSLENYIHTPEYIELLNNILKNSINLLDNTDNLTIYLTDNDMKKVNFSEYGTLKTLDNSYIGGLIIENQDMIIDNTFLANLKEKIYGTKENN